MEVDPRRRGGRPPVVEYQTTPGDRTPHQALRLFIEDGTTRTLLWRGSGKDHEKLLAEARKYLKELGIL